MVKQFTFKIKIRNGDFYLNLFLKRLIQKMGLRKIIDFFILFSSSLFAQTVRYTMLVITYTSPKKLKGSIFVSVIVRMDCSFKT